MTKPQKLDSGLANSPGMKWYLPEFHASGVPFGAECCQQYRTKQECIDEISRLEEKEGPCLAEPD